MLPVRSFLLKKKLYFDVLVSVIVPGLHFVPSDCQHLSVAFNDDGRKDMLEGVTRFVGMDFEIFLIMRLRQSFKY